MRYLIDGCYGDGNVGDECLLMAVERLIRQVDPTAEVVALTSDSAATQRDTGLETVPQCNPLGSNLYGALAKGLLWRAIRAIQQADVFVLGGGELYRDQPGFSATFGMFYRAKLARLLGKRVVALGVGVQSPTRWWGRSGLQAALAIPHAVVCRDGESTQLAGRWLGDSQTLHTAPDLVFSLDWQRYRPKFISSPQGPLQVGIAVKSLPRNHASHVDVHQHLWTPLIGALREQVAVRPLQFHILPFADDDQAFAAKVAYELATAGLQVVNIETPRIEPLRRRVASLDLLLALPLHASIFGFSCGVPTLGLAYDRKVTRLYDRFQMREACLEPGQWDERTIGDRLAMLRNRHMAISGHLRTMSEDAATQVRSVVTPLLAPAPVAQCSLLRA